MEIIKSMGNMTGMLMKKNFFKAVCVTAIAFFVALNLSGCTSGDDTEVLTDGLQEVQEDTMIPMEESPSDSETTDTSSVNVPEEADTDEMIAINIENLGRPNPFLPPGESEAQIASIPTESLKYDVLPPLEEPVADPSAKTVATTKVSGIMYDKNSPSAILNIDGMDYLVRSGDVLNGYKVLSIGKSVVTVQLGSNVYKAGVGELLAEGRGDITYNQVANLSNKFGGSKK